MRYLALAVSALLILTPNSMAQDATHTPSDTLQMQDCWETVHTINADTESGQTASLRECIGAASRACQDEAPENQTTFGMMTCNQREMAWWDEQLNWEYAALKESLQPEVFDALREAQRAWIAYRDASCLFEYKYWEEGTIRQVVASGCLLQRTAERAIDLSAALEWTNS